MSEPANGRDYLTKLPAELLHIVFSYLFPTHSPEKAVQGSKHDKPCSHALDNIAATNKLLRSEVSEWALHFLLSHKDITKFSLPKSATKKKGTVNHLRGRKGLLTWSSNHCVWCGRPSKRSAILMNGLRCCSACDKAQWDKITRTDAKKKYNLKDENLFPGRFANSPTSRKLLAQHGPSQLRYGTYTCQGAEATMFLHEDVKYLAARVHGELGPYLEKREAARVARSAKAEDKKRNFASLLMMASVASSSQN